MSGWAKVRMIDIAAQSYQLARQYMIQLSNEDFKDPVVLGRYATLAGMSLDAFQDRLQPLVRT